MLARFELFLPENQGVDSSNLSLGTRRKLGERGVQGGSIPPPQLSGLLLDLGYSVIKVRVNQGTAENRRCSDTDGFSFCVCLLSLSELDYTQKTALCQVFVPFCHAKWC